MKTEKSQDTPTTTTTTTKKTEIKAVVPPSTPMMISEATQRPSTAQDNLEEEEDEEQFVQELDPEYEKYLRTRNDESQQQMQSLLALMTPEQQTRYETYRSAAFPKAAVKKLMQQILGQNITERMAVMVAGVMKLHVGQLVELCKN